MLSVCKVCLDLTLTVQHTLGTWSMQSNTGRSYAHTRGPLNTDVHPLLSGPPLRISLGAHTGPYPSALSRAQASGRRRAQPQGGGKQQGQYSPSSAVHSHSCRDTLSSSPRTHGRRLTAYTAQPARYLEMAMLPLDFLFSGLNSPNFFCLFSEAVFLNLQSFSLLSSGLSPRFCILFKL